MAISIITGIGVAAAVGGSVYSGVQQSQAAGEQKKASEAAAGQLAAQTKLQQEANKKLEDQAAGKDAEAEATRLRDQEKERQRQLAGIASGRSGTILTGPLGLETEPTTANKTLLGL